MRLTEGRKARSQILDILCTVNGGTECRKMVVERTRAAAPGRHAGSRVTYRDGIDALHLLGGLDGRPATACELRLLTALYTTGSWDHPAVI